MDKPGCKYVLLLLFAPSFSRIEASDVKFRLHKCLCLGWSTKAIAAQVCNFRLLTHEYATKWGWTSKIIPQVYHEKKKCHINGRTDPIKRRSALKSPKFHTPSACIKLITFRRCSTFQLVANFCHDINGKWCTWNAGDWNVEAFSPSDVLVSYSHGPFVSACIILIFHTPLQ